VAPPSDSAPPPVRLAITLGDPRGIGREITVAALAAIERAAYHLTVIGPAGTDADQLGDRFVPVGTWQAGGSLAEAGRLAGQAIAAATRLALDGEVEGIVTAPIDKAALHAGGYLFPGHTEMLAALAQVPEVVMLMSAERTALGGALRVVLATTHLALADVPARFTRAVLEHQTRITHEALRAGWGLVRPRLALCAFNPHASDGGLFGDQEARIYAPVVHDLRAEGMAVTGPVPADTVFLRAVRGEFDAVIAPYHDVGMAAFKTAAFGQGVNVTLGLPFVRTSPDHGTALDIAGRGIADAGSMRAAIELARTLVLRRRAPNPVATEP
jgi:4-hydroxythreonine-4-phosphate dehydrogenase